MTAENRWISVTQLLRWHRIIPDLSFLSLWQRENAMRRGRYVHHGCHLLAKGQGIDLAWTTAHPECEGHFAGYAKFLAEHDFTLREAELEIKIPSLKVFGYVDQFGILDGHLSNLELKSGADPDSSALQTAGYALAFDRVVKRYVLRLPGDGNYRLIAHTNFRELDKFRGLAQAYWIAIEYGAKEG